MNSIGILVTGARDWTDTKLVYNVLQKYKNKKCVLIHGDCIGLDKIAGKIGDELGMEIKCCPADWKRFGRAAGPIRNKEMITHLLEYKKHYMFAFHDNIELSRGTKNCVKQANKMKIPITIISH
jgi:hypothetical protein